MLKAYVNERLVFASKSGERGICPLCGTEMVARVGSERVPHWAHKIKSECDPWYEQESKWHFDLYKQFDVLISKKIQLTDQSVQFGELYDKKGEKHYVNVLAKNRVVQFRNTPISLDLRAAYERFFDNLTWIVQISNKNKVKKFGKSFGESLYSTKKLGHDQIVNSRQIYWLFDKGNVLPKVWAESSVPLVLDFSEDVDVEDDQKTNLAHSFWLVIPHEYERLSMVLRYKKEALIDKLCFEAPQKDVLLNYLNKHQDLKETLKKRRIGIEINRRYIR